MQLQSEFFYRVKTSGPLPTTSGSPHGERQYWIVSEAELAGARIHAKLAAPGSDWMWVSNDGFWRSDVVSRNSASPSRPEAACSRQLRC
jgi:hypothetical protein